MLKYCNETFTYFNLKGKNIKSSEYSPTHPQPNLIMNTVLIIHLFLGCLSVVTVLEIIKN